MANRANLATSTVATAPSPATSGTSLIVQSGDGALFPSTPFFATAHPDNVLPTVDNAEIVEVTNVSSDTFTISRAQKGTTAKSIATNWRISNTIYAEEIDERVVGPSSVTDDLPAIFDGTTGKLIKQKTYSAFKTLLALVKGDVGLGNVDNTSDATKNAATATLTNKTIDGDNNTLQDIPGSALKDGAVTPAKRAGGYASGTLNLSSATSGVTVSGLTFAPKYLKFRGCTTSTNLTDNNMHGVFDGTNIHCVTSVSDGSNAASRYYNDRVAVLAPGATPSTAARVDTFALTSDGFTYTVTNNSATVTIVWEAYG